MKKILSTAIAVGTLACILPGGIALGFNSEEHKYLGDAGSAAVPVCGGNVTGKCRPATISSRFQPLLQSYDPRHPASKVALVTKSQQTAFRREALARQPGYESKRMTGQKHYVEEIYIPPDDSAVAPLLVWVGNASLPTDGEWFTFGDLVAIYGDYRRAVTCDGDDANCLLTDALDGHTVTALDHLRGFARGEVPPFGSLGNTTSNSDPNGNATSAPWWGDEMLRIANTNDWHFNRRAIYWYTGLHRQALSMAALAAERNDPASLWQAVHMEANGLHSLTDLFAPGHIIANREKSVDGMFKNNSASWTDVFDWNHAILGMGQPSMQSLAPIAAPRQSQIGSDRGTWVSWARWEEAAHTQFNKNGAIVRNNRGDEFIAFGDGRLFTCKEEAAKNGKVHPQNPGKLPEVAAAAVTHSLQALFEAYAQLLQAGGSKTGDTRISAVETKAKEIVGGVAYYDALNDVPIDIKEACYKNADGFCYGVGRWMAAGYRGEVLGTLKVGKLASEPDLPEVTPVDGEKWVSQYKFDKGKGQVQAVQCGLPAREPDKL